jgi:hypothetical protein
MTAPTKAWQWDLNRIPAADPSGVNGLEFAFDVKAYLSGQRGGATQGTWTPVQGSDGVVVGTDPWGSAWDGTRINRALLSAAVNITVASAATGGTLPAGTYFYAVIPINANGILGQPFYEQSRAVTGTTSTVTLTWTSWAVSGAVKYRVYRGTVTGQLNTYWETTGTTWTDTGAAGTAGVPPMPTYPSGTAPVGYTTAWAAHSWQVLRSPPVTAGAITNVPFYLIIDVNGAQDWTSGNYTFCKTLPTGGTIYARPTSPDEWNYSSLQTAGSSATASKFHHWLTPEGGFILGVTKTAPANTTSPNLILGFQVLADAQPTDQFPVIGWALSTESWNGGAFSEQAQGNIKGRGWNGVLLGTQQLVWLRGSNDPAISSYAGGDVQVPGSYGELPIHVYTFDVGQQTYRGRIVDIYVACSDGSKNLWSEPNTTAPTSQVIGMFWMPVNQAVIY